MIMEGRRKSSGWRRMTSVMKMMVKRTRVEKVEEEGEVKEL